MATARVQSSRNTVYLSSISAALVGRANLSAHRASASWFARVASIAFSARHNRAPYGSLQVFNRSVAAPCLVQRGRDRRHRTAFVRQRLSSHPWESPRRPLDRHLIQWRGRVLRHRAGLRDRGVTQARQVAGSRCSGPDFIWPSARRPLIAGQAKASGAPIAWVVPHPWQHGLRAPWCAQCADSGPWAPGPSDALRFAPCRRARSVARCSLSRA